MCSVRCWSHRLRELYMLVNNPNDWNMHFVSFPMTWSLPYRLSQQFYNSAFCLNSLNKLFKLFNCLNTVSKVSFFFFPVYANVLLDIRECLGTTICLFEVVLHWGQQCFSQERAGWLVESVYGLGMWIINICCTRLEELSVLAWITISLILELIIDLHRESILQSEHF